MQKPAPTPSSRKPAFFYVIALIAVGLGVGLAISQHWVCDDAFISYRYALNLVEGKGLVFNAGERVEGYTNFLWTIWCAVGLLLHCSAEYWSMAWGVVCHAASLGLLGYLSLLLRRRSGAWSAGLPIALILGAVHEDWGVFATSGLEGSLFTALAIAGYVLLAHGVIRGRHHPVGVGVVMTLCAMTRPDGMIFAVIAGGSLAWFSGWKWRPILFFALAFGVPQAAFMAWRVSYYGDFFPNTYYAKSGNLAWWEQGFHYLELYLQKYWVLGAAVPALAVALIPRRKNPKTSSAPNIHERLAIAAAAMGGAYIFFVTRVGGDFMFARMLVPATPFLFIIMELAVDRMWANKTALQFVVAAALVLALVLPPYPMANQELVQGIANEHSYYGDYLLREKSSATLRKYLSDLPVNVSFIGSEAHRMYRGRIPVAIESEAGLTDRFIAHQSIAQRGRIGHEKSAPLDYLIGRRKAHFLFQPNGTAVLGLANRIPNWIIKLDGMPGNVLHWDPVVMAELRRRGAEFDDFPAFLDRIISELDKYPVNQVIDMYQQAKIFYFDHVDDPVRERAFTSKIGGVNPASAPAACSRPAGG